VGDWISVFCRRAVRLDPPLLRAALDDADLYVLAEALELDDDQDDRVDALLDHLRVEAGPVGIDVHWWPDRRPIQVGAHTGAAADERVAETLEEQDDLPDGIGDHLADCVQVVDIELVLDPVGDLNETVAEVLAFAVAAAGDGLVWFYDQEWVDATRETVWVG